MPLLLLASVLMSSVLALPSYASSAVIQQAPATDGPACGVDYYYGPDAATNAEKADYSADRRPIVYVHGWTSNPDMWRGNFNFAAKLESQISDGGPKRTQNFLFSYASNATLWASEHQIAACLGEYIEQIGIRYESAGGDGKVLVVGHSMGGLATLYSTTERYAEFPSANRLGGVVTLDTPYLGAYAGGWNPFKVTDYFGRVFELNNGRKTGTTWFPPAETDAMNCLAVHSLGAAIPAPCLADLPPNLPEGVPLTQIAGNITVKRNVFGVVKYDLPLNSDGVVPLDSQLGYLKIRKTAPERAGRVTSERVPCSISTGELNRGPALLRTVAQLANAPESTITVLNDFSIVSRMGASSAPNSQDVTRYTQALAIAAMANLKADCSHTHIYQNQSALNKTTEAIKKYLSDLDESGDTVDNASYRISGLDDDIYAFVHPSRNIACVMGDSADLKDDEDANTICLDKNASWIADARPDASICPVPQSWGKQFVALMKAGVSAGICTGDNPTYSAKKVLPVGKSITAGSATCRSTEQGVDCTDSNLGTGFQVNTTTLKMDGQRPYWTKEEEVSPLFSSTKLYCDTGYRLNYIVTLKSGGEAGRCALGDDDKGYLLFYSDAYTGTDCQSYGSGPKMCLVLPNKVEYGDVSMYAVDSSDPDRRISISNTSFSYTLNGQYAFSDEVTASAARK